MTSIESGSYEIPRHRGHVTRYEGDVTYGHISPEHKATGKPVLFLPGVGEDLPTISPVSSWIAEPGNSSKTHDVYLVQHARWRYRLSSRAIRKLYKNAPPEALAMGVPILRRAHEAILMLDETRQKMHLVGHSLGGPTAVAVALLRPDLIESITLINSAGTVGKMGWGRLLARFFGNLLVRQLFTRDPRVSLPIIGKTIFSYLAQNPFRAIREARASANTDLTPTIVALGKRGVKINLVYDKLDWVFPSKEVEEQIRIAGGVQAPFKIIKTDRHIHYGPIASPKVFGELVSKLLDDVERR